MKKNHFKHAVEYVKQNLKQYEIDRGWDYLSNREPLPFDMVMRIANLLEEYGCHRHGHYSQV